MAALQNLSQMLKDYPKEVILKDGTGVTLRPLQEGDEALLYRMYDRLTDEDRWFLSHDVADFELIQTWVKTRDVNRDLSIVAILEGRIIAHATLIMKYFGAKSHIGKIRISVDPDLREKKLGTWMLLDLINLAMALDLEILEMHLVGGRDASLIRSVKRLDFSEEATLRDYVRDSDGNPYGLDIMVKRLRRELGNGGESFLSVRD